MWPLGISVECVFRYWEQTLKKRDMLGDEGFHRREESNVFYQGLIGPLGMGQRGRRGEFRWFATELGLRLGNWIWRNGVEMKICRYPG